MGSLEVRTGLKYTAGPRIEGRGDPGRTPWGRPDSGSSHRRLILTGLGK